MSPIRVAGEEVARDGVFVIEGNLFTAAAELSAWGTSSVQPTAYAPGDSADLGDGVTLTVQGDGAYVLTSPVTTEGHAPAAHLCHCHDPARIHDRATTPTSSPMPGPGNPSGRRF